MNNNGGPGAVRGRRTLMMLHGGGPGVDAASNWRGVIDQLSDAFDCIAPDLMGFGERITADAGPLPKGPAEWARHRAHQMCELMDQLSLDRVVLLGNSAAGGAAALALMSLSPDRVERAVVMGGAGTGPLPPTVPFYDDPTHERMKATLGRLVADAHAHEALIDELADERLDRALSRGAERAFRSMFSPDPETSPRLNLSTITQPVLALHGELDHVSPLEVSYRLVATLPRGELQVVAGAGHWIHVDQPQVFCDRVTGFLNI